MIKRPVLRYHGGKFKLAPWIISHFPEHRVYTEVFGGAASVLMQKKRSYAEVYNDKWDTVVNVFRVLRDPQLASQLTKCLTLTPFARDEFEMAGEKDLSLINDPVEKARLTVFRSFAGFGSASTNNNHATGFRSNSNRSGTTPAHDWKDYPNHIESFVERLRGVVIENRDYKEVLIQHDSIQTLHFIDPPYVHETRNMKRGNAAYVHEMSDDDHRELAGVISGLYGMVIVSGYESELYSEIFSEWSVIKKSAFADGARKRVECLWLNDHAASKQKQIKLFA